MGQIGQIAFINISQGGVPKLSVPSAEVTLAGLIGDRQKSLKYHGGPDRAVCLWSLDVIETLQQEGHTVAPGCAGENVTVAGLTWGLMMPGTRLQLGDALQLEITEYTAPCYQIKRWFTNDHFNRISQDHYPGSSRLYARVISEGKISVGNPIQILD
jgi:MOSC domain-containing protein YiiM